MSSDAQRAAGRHGVTNPYMRANIFVENVGNEVGLSMSKGSKRRPSFVAQHEEMWRWDLALGRIDSETFQGYMRCVDWLRSNQHTEFCQMPADCIEVAKFIGKKKFERFDGVSGFIPCSPGEFVETFIYRLRG